MDKKYKKEIENLNNIISINENRYNYFYSIAEEKYDAYLSKVKSLINPFFNFIPDDIEVRLTKDNIYFYRQNNELFKLNLEKTNFHDDNYNKIEPNYYTTSTINQFELERLELLGKVARVILNDSDKIIDILNTEYKKYEDSVKKTRRLYFKISNHIDKTKYKINDLKTLSIRENFIDGNGYTFSKIKTLSRTSTDEICNVNSIKYIRKVSDKTHEIEVIRNSSNDKIQLRNEYFDKLIYKIKNDLQEKKEAVKAKFKI
jgi:hypothetical protein